MNYNLKLSLEIWKRLIFLKQRSKSNILKYYPTAKYINCTLKGGDELKSQLPWRTFKTISYFSF